MNKEKTYRPAILYTFLLLALWVASWFIGVAELLMSGTDTMNSLLSAEGVRWALRNALSCLESAPWGIAMMCVVAVGLLEGSGLLHTMRESVSSRHLSENRRYAALMSLAVLCVIAALLFMTCVAPWNILGGITPGWEAHPLVAGAVPLLFIAVAAASMMHGAVYGSYRSVADIVRGVCRAVAVFASALVALIPASGIISCAEYMGIFRILGLGGGVQSVAECALYLLPFLYAAPSLLRGGDIQ